MTISFDCAYKNARFLIFEKNATKTLNNKITYFIINKNHSIRKTTNVGHIILLASFMLKKPIFNNLFKNSKFGRYLSSNNKINCNKSSK